MELANIIWLAYFRLTVTEYETFPFKFVNSRSRRFLA